MENESHLVSGHKFLHRQSKATLTAKFCENVLCFYSKTHKPFIVTCVNIIRTLDHKVLHIRYDWSLLSLHILVLTHHLRNMVVFFNCIPVIFNNHTSMTKVTNLQLWFISIRPSSFYKVYRILYYVKGCVCNKIMTVKLN